MDKKLKSLYETIGLPRLIILLFLLALCFGAVILSLNIYELIGNILVRIGMNGILVLAMVPSVQSGTGLNFGLPLGIIAGLLGALISIELNLVGFQAFRAALLISLPIAVAVGWGYGMVLNKVKGQEMTVGTYVGFSAISGMCIVWLLAPFRSPQMIWPYGGVGLRTTISLEATFGQVLNNFGKFSIGDVTIPTGLLLFYAAICFLVWLFGKTKTGMAVMAAGSNPRFAESSGISPDKSRIIGMIFSTVLAAIGILVYYQSFGFLQLYNAPLYMAFPAVAAVLIGGASVKKATITHAIVGTILFQAILVIALPVTNEIIPGNMSEIVRIIVSQGIILYALTRETGGETG